MDNITFVNSTLKVTAKEDIDMVKELASENPGKTIDELIKENNEKKTEE